MYASIAARLTNLPTGGQEQSNIPLIKDGVIKMLSSYFITMKPQQLLFLPSFNIPIFFKNITFISRTGVSVYWLKVRTKKN